MKMNAQSNKLLFAAILLVIIYFIRMISHQPVLVGEESYYSLRISEEIKNHAVIQNDPLGSEYTFSALDYLIAPFGESIKNFLPLILGLLTGLFYFKIIDKKYSAISTSLLYLSPLFLTTFTVLSNEMLAIFLVVLNAVVIKNKRVILFTIIQTIIALTHFEIWLFSSIYFLYTNRNYVAYIPGVIVAIFTFSMTIGFERVFSELGAAYGYSLFLFLLGIIGFVWRKKNLSRTALFIPGIITTLFIPEIRLLGTLILLPYASRAIIKLIDRKWELSHIKQATLFLIFLVIVFSSITKASEITAAEPNSLLVYERLKDLPRGTVLAKTAEGHYIQYFANKPVLVDRRSSEKEKFEAEELLSSQNSVFVQEQLRIKGIKYILVDAPEQRTGFLFVADNSENFNFLASHGKELWEFTG